MHATNKTGALPRSGRKFRSNVRGLATAAVGPVFVTLLALPEPRIPALSAALLYVLVVVVAAGVGGPVAGVAASLLSFLALNFFFTVPHRTFLVGEPEDLVALLVFLLVSVITGLLLSTTLREKARAEAREQQARLVAGFTDRLLTGDPLDDALRDLAKGLVGFLDLAECEIHTAMTEPVRISAGGDVGDPFEVPLISKAGPVGTMRARAHGSRKKLGYEERTFIENVCGQLSLALERTMLTDEVRSAQVEAETNRLRAALFSGVTHDLKTPLSAITASVTSLLEDTPFTREQRFEHLDTIRQEAERLNRVVSNLMDLARFRAGALVPRRQPAAIDELIEAVVARMRPFLGGRDVRLSLRGDLPEMSIDIVQIDQVLTNVIENAAKFSPAGSPIEITAAGGPDKVRVTVSDRGAGIPLDDRDRIFQAFERGRTEVAGTGLGLAIARAAVVAHGGRMWAQDAPSGGAAVTFELPTKLEGDT